MEGKYLEGIEASMGMVMSSGGGGVEAMVGSGEGEDAACSGSTEDDGGEG